MTDVDDRAELLRDVPLFAACTEDELARIAALAKPRSAAAGDELCKQGDPGDEFFVLLDGGADVLVDGDKVTVFTSGSFFGEMALIDGGERTATVVATAPCELLVLDRHDFNEMLSTAMPHIVPRLVQTMGQRIRELAKHAGQPLPY
jgi:CRP-like cAMP-binding protein